MYLIIKTMNKLEYNRKLMRKVVFLLACNYFQFKLKGLQPNFYNYVELKSLALVPMVLAT